VGSDQRGSTLEAVVCRLKLRLPSARILAVSATICNPDDISAWLGAPKALTFDSSYRPVPLRLEVVGFEQRTNDFIFDRNLERELRPLILANWNYRPTLVFCATRKGAKDSAMRLWKDWIHETTKCALLLISHCCAALLTYL